MFSVLVLVLIFRPSGLLGEVAAGQGLDASRPAIALRGCDRAAAGLLATAASSISWPTPAPSCCSRSGLNIVVGFAGLLDLGYAAFFAIGSYAFAMLASPQFGIHVPFWVMLFLASGIAAVFGILLGAPTLRLRGDYLAIVTLGFGEIVPQTFLNLAPVDRRSQRHPVRSISRRSSATASALRCCRTTTSSWR